MRRLLTVFRALLARLRSKRVTQLPPLTSDGPIYVQSSPDPRLEASIWMTNYAYGGEVCEVGKTGSMKPLLNGGEIAVLANAFSAIRIGDVVAYRTVGGSSPAIGSRLIHRIVGGNWVDGWIPQGDTPGALREDWNPITRENYIGTLVAIFRQR